MITIESLKKSHIERVKSIELAEGQIRFAGTAAAFLLDGSKTMHLHVIQSGGDIIGFFKLDTAYSTNYDFCPEGSLGLRAFALDKNQQGKGLGTQSVKALLPYLKAHYGMYHWIYLSVNIKNPGAVTCYKKGGFEDMNKLYLGGDAGPQHIMRGKIR